MREIGSFFEYPNVGDLGNSPVEREFLKDAHLLASGRDAFAFLGKLLGRRKMLVPDYFCPHTASFISKYFDIERYKDTPGEPPVLNTLSKGCVLLAVNTFGMHNPGRCDIGKLRNDIILIEDHSHAPFSKYAYESSADYCIASLRKTLPLGSGAYLKPKANMPALQILGDGENQDAIFYKAARKKKSYLNEGLGNKLEFLSLFNELEDIVENNSSVRAMGRESRDMLLALNIRKLQNIRADNFFLFKGIVNVPLLNKNIAEANSVFNPVLLLDSLKIRDALRRHLIEEKIYPPIHWSPLGAGDISKESKSLSERVLTIPLDHRYSKSEVERVAKVINTFLYSKLGK